MPTFFLHKNLQIFTILLVVMIAATSAYFVAGIRIEQDNESMQSNEAKNDPVYALFNREFDAQYELLLSITRDNACTDLEQLERDIEWTRNLAGVQQVYFPSSIDDSNGFISKDRQTVAFLITLDSNQSRTGRMHLFETLRVQAPKQIQGSVQVVGLPLVKERVAHHIARDQSVIIPLSICVMVIILALLFRRIAGIVLPMLVVGMTLISTLGIYAACGLELNSITSLLPPVVIVLSVTVSVHLFDAWNHEVRAGATGKTAIRAAVAHVWKPCVFTAAMTAVGLLSLCFSPVPAVRLFGLFSAIGAMLSVLFAFMMLPIALGWTQERTCAGKRLLIGRLLQGAANWPARFPVAILLTALFITLASAWAATNVKNNTDLIRFFKKSDPTYMAHAEVNRTLGSVRSIDLLMQRTDKGAFNPKEDGSALAKFIEKIERIPDVVRVDCLPKNTTAASALMARFVADEGRIIRAQIHLGDIGSARAATINCQIQDIATTEMGAAWTIQSTGDYYQMVRDSNQLVTTLLKSFAVSLIIVMGSTCLLFGSIRMLAPAFIPNILPVIWGAGLMGLIGIDLSTGTTMVAAVVIGLAIDDTIHYLHHFQSFKHLPIGRATQLTTQRIGPALTASTIVLVGGFWMGAFGSFIPTNTFALLTGCMMISALFCDLFVLPAYLNIADRFKRKGVPNE